MRVFTYARRFAAAGVGAALGLAALGLPAAHADAQPPTLFSDFDGTQVAPGTAGKTLWHQIGGSAAAPTTFTGVTVTYDVSGLAGVAKVAPQSGACSTAGKIITCHVGDLSVNMIGEGLSATPYTGFEYLPLKIVPAAGAAAGASGTIAATVSADSVAASSSTISVSLADGPDLQMHNTTPGFTPVAVGAASSYARAVKFTNVGDQAAQGVTLEIAADSYGVDVPELHNNCQYAPGTAYCYLPDLVAPGATETLSPTVQVLTTSDLMWDGLRIAVVPGYASLPVYTVGTGKPFLLKDASGKAQTPVDGKTAQSSIDGTDGQAYLKLQVSGATADLAATASVFAADQPGQYQVSLVPFNNGSGFIQLGRSGSFMVTGDVVFPAGVTLTGVPSTWTQVPNSTPGATEYRFEITTQVASGSGFYGVALPTVVPQPGFAGDVGTFTVSVNSQSPSAFTGEFGDIDTNAANDTTTFSIPAFGS